MRCLPTFAAVITCAAIGVRTTFATGATEHSCGVDTGRRTFGTSATRVRGTLATERMRLFDDI